MKKNVILLCRFGKDRKEEPVWNMQIYEENTQQDFKECKEISIFR